MMQKIVVLFVVFFMTLNASAGLKTPSSLGIKEDAPWIDYPSLDEVRDRAHKNAIESLSASEDLGVFVERAFTSNWYILSITDPKSGKESQQMLIDETATHWVPYDSRSILLLQNGLSKVNVSNSVREDLMALSTFVLSEKNDYISYPAYGGKTERWVIAFMDPLCPYCRAFHVNVLSKLRSTGVGVVYLPFLRNPRDKKSSSVWRRAFCSSDPTLRKEIVDDIFLIGPKKAKVKYAGSPTCENRLRSALLEPMLKSAAIYPISGSPMFVSEQGRVYYGADALLNGIK